GVVHDLRLEDGPGVLFRGARHPPHDPMQHVVGVGPADLRDEGRAELLVRFVHGFTPVCSKNISASMASSSLGIGSSPAFSHMARPIATRPKCRLRPFFLTLADLWVLE